MVQKSTNKVLLKKKRKLFISIFIISILFIFYVIAAGYSLYRKDLKSEQSRMYLLESQLKEQTVSFFSNYLSLFVMLSEVQAIQVKNTEELNDLFFRLNHRFSEFENIAAVDEKGFFFASGKPFDLSNPPNISKLLFFQKIKNGDEFVIMEPHVGPISHQKVTGIVVRLEDESHLFTGLLGTSIKLSHLTDKWVKFAEKNNIKLFCYRGNKDIIFSEGIDELKLNSFFSDSTINKRFKIDKKQYSYTTISISELDSKVVLLSENYISFLDEFISSPLHIVITVLFLITIIFLVFLYRKEVIWLKLLIQSETLLNATQKISKVGGWEWDVKKQTMFWTDEVYRIHDFQQSEFHPESTKHIELSFECYDPEDRPIIVEAFRNCVEKGQSYDLEFPFTKVTGDRIWIRTKAEPVMDGKRIIKVIGNIIDITERKQSEMALISSEHKWRNILINTPQIGITLDTKAKITFANIHFLKLTGWEEHEVIGQDWFDMFIPEHVREEVREVFLTVMSQKDTIGFSTYENEIIDRSGMLINVAWSNALTKDAHGNVIGVTCLGVDLTERQHSEQALKKSEIKYRTMMEALRIPVYIGSKDYKIQYMNQTMVERIGYDATGESCYKSLHGFDEKCPWCESKITFLKGHTEKDILSPKDNRSFNVSSSIFINEDESLSKLSVFRDTTEFKALQNQIQQAQKLEAIGTLAGGIAHDFNNILFPIVGHTEMLLEDVPGDSPFRDSLKEIYTGAMRASELVKQILTFSRQENSELKLMKIQPIIKEALKLIRSTIPTTIEIKQDINPDCGVIKADPTQIHQIVMNLATNAYHAMEDTGGELVVSLKEMELGAFDLINQDMTPGVYACLIVADTGVGMNKNLLDKIFDPFFTTKEQGKGTGMGLSVVHGIVHGLGGAIQVYSEPGKGTEFYVYFPVEKKSIKEQNIQTKEPIQSGTEQILLVDDEEAILIMEKKMLERLGYQVTSRTSSLEALEAFRDSPDKFDLVITDMAMPNMPGDKLSAELTKIRPDIPVLLCTGFSEVMSEEKAASLGIKGFLLKPIVMKDLSRKIREAFDDK